MKSIEVYSGISNNPHASSILLYMPWYRAEFQYDELGRPTSVKRRCYHSDSGLNFIDIESQIQYPDTMSVNLFEYRFDHGNDEDGCDTIVYEYPVDIYSFSPFYRLTTMYAPYWTLILTHDKDGRLLSSDQYSKTEDKKYSYKFSYENGNLSDIDNLSYEPTPEKLWSLLKHPNVNIDYNMLLLTTDFLSYNFGASLPMIMRMGGNIGDNLMKTYFIQSGKKGGGHYGYFPKDDAGKTLHFTGNYVAYNENWQGCPVEYVFEGESVKQIKIHLPVVYYAYEYDVVVGTEPLDPKDPDSLYPYERFENEKSEALTSCDLVYEYNFTYFTKEDMIH